MTVKKVEILLKGKGRLGSVNSGVEIRFSPKKCNQSIPKTIFVPLIGIR